MGCCDCEQQLPQVHAGGGHALQLLDQKGPQDHRIRAARAESTDPVCQLLGCPCRAGLAGL